ncbi:gliding motility protein MglA [Labilithrix luteola]|uniref:Gliding motility protein MglA n=1 Tax=Labilithrix luteola TaxID=1391654 RepID=A0A0K1PK57_9BACT|nr:GTPase domain-containing protein [Labilithrix luteola]AKU93494.1 gliding motility protein MglA [Labilithrix luteola]
MAVFDLREKRMCVRIVYDGLAGAGKTTNLRQLSGLFATQRTSDLVSPAEIEGRTLYFDWMQIKGGVVCGFPLICQVISVPGQVVLTERRRHLLSTADVVVYVTDSARSAVANARSGLAVLDEVARERDEAPLIVVQANKQDQIDVLTGPAILDELGRPGTVCVEAIARDGIGVVDTFVAAVRAIARAVQAKVEREELRIPVARPQGPRALLQRLEALEVDPEWAAEMFLEEATAEFLTSQDTDVSPIVPPPPPLSSLHGDAAPFPRTDVPTGYVWPAHTGRACLRSVSHAAISSVPLDDDGAAETHAEGFRLWTSRRWYFEDADSARQGIVRSARERTQLGPLLSPDTVLVLQPVDEEKSWLWTIAPAVPSVREWLHQADGDAERHRRLEAFGAAVANGLAYAMQYGVGLDTSADAFGVEDGTIRYFGELTAIAPDGLTTMMDRALASVERRVDDLTFFVECIERELDRRSMTAPAVSEARARMKTALSQSV